MLGFGPDLPDGVVSLDEVIEGAAQRRAPGRDAAKREGPLLVTFTARRGMPFLPVAAATRTSLLAQGAMTVLALDLDTRDVILNPYPLTGPAGLALGLMPWLISGATLAQHHPFDYDAFAAQLLATGATVTALPAPVLAALATDGVLAPAAMPLAAARRGVAGAGASRAAAVSRRGAADVRPLSARRPRQRGAEAREPGQSRLPSARQCASRRRGRGVRGDQAARAKRRGRRTPAARADRAERRARDAAGA